MGDEVEIDPEKQEVRARRNLRKSGNSTVVAIPPQVLDGAGLEQGDRVELVAKMGEETIRLTKIDEETD